MILPLALILCFMVGCQDKAAMAELEAMNAQADVEEQNREIVRRWVEEEDKGTHKGEFMGIEPTENEINVGAVWICRIKEGKIIEVRGVGDLLSLMQQLGMELKPKEESLL